MGEHVARIWNLMIALESVNSRDRLRLYASAVLEMMLNKELLV